MLQIYKQIANTEYKLLFISGGIMGSTHGLFENDPVI